MKSLQDFKSVSISEFEMRHLMGGLATPVRGSFTVMGSAFSYSGTLDLTVDRQTKASTFIVESTGTSYVTDFCGSSSYDGGNSGYCAQYIDGHWIIAGA